MNFSKQTTSNSIKASNGELAWRKENVINAIDELVKHGYAILGGDVWAVKSKLNESELKLTKLADGQIAIGILKTNNGEDVIYNWYSTKKDSETWKDYIERSKQETLNFVKKCNAEEETSTVYNHKIYYNLVYSSEQEFEKLK